MASKLKLNAIIAKIDEFLVQVRISNFCIHLKLVEFSDAKDRQCKITLCNKLIAKGLLKNVAQTQSEELADANALSISIKSVGILVSLCWECQCRTIECVSIVSCGEALSIKI
jgi:hypothetical protein